MDFGEVLTRAWHITWKYKVLWLFGVLAGCGGTANSSLNFNGGGSGGGGGGGNGDVPPQLQPFVDQFNSIPEEQIALIIIALVCVGLLLGLVFLLIGTVGKIGLINGAMQGDQNVASLGVGELFETVRPFFLRVLGLNLLLGILSVVAGIIIVVAVVGVSIVTLGIGLICLIPLLCLLIPVGFVVNIIVQQANIALIVDDLDIVTALQEGWNIVRDNLANYIVLGLILGVGLSLVVGGILAAPFIFIVAPVFISLALGGEAAVGTGIAFALICGVLYLPILILARGVLNTYINTAWTVTFLRLSGRGGQDVETLDTPALLS
jgi:hypothetical protein